EVSHDVLCGLVVSQCQDVLPGPPYVLDDGSIALGSDEGARGIDMPSRKPAVEPDPHEAARAQPRQQRPPPRPRIGHVMQHAARIHDVEYWRFHICRTG